MIKSEDIEKFNDEVQSKFVGSIMRKKGQKITWSLDSKPVATLEEMQGKSDFKFLASLSKKL